jgi:hypothetical protein
MAQKQNTQTTSEEVLNDDTVRELLQLRAKKLGVLLATANLPDEQKEAWASLIPSLTVEQVDELTGILEADYMNNATAKIDDYFSRRAKEMAEQFAKEDAETVKRIDEEMKSIDKVYKKLGDEQ